MTQRRITATDQISTVIDALQLGKKTGILTVERGANETFEEGTLIFVHGQVLQAFIGTYRGRDAGAQLFSWQACRFSFVSMLPEQLAQKSSSSPHSHPDTNKLQVSLYGQPPPQTERLDGMNRCPLVVAHYKEATNEILQLLDQRGFSRSHRRLFLLINGRRSISDLATLIGRTPNETVVLLADLEQAGFIRV